MSMTRIAAADLTPMELVERVLSVSEQLTDVIRRESELLESNQPLSIGELQEEKIRLSNEYAMDIQAISLRKELIDRAPAEKINRLKTAMATLNTALERNGNLLLAAKSVSERILKSVADTVNEHKAPSLGYGRNAAMTNKTTSRSAAIALDSRV
jgi:parvulin-like peptidyl-prolyl isomerase